MPQGRQVWFVRGGVQVCRGHAVAVKAAACSGGQVRRGVRCSGVGRWRASVVKTSWSAGAAAVRASARCWRDTPPSACSRSAAGIGTRCSREKW
eukprot:5400579-Lingulodinium_polyedra.AAC.1